MSIWIAGQLHAYTDAGDLRRELPGLRADGRTSGADLVYLLEKHAISCDRHAPFTGRLKDAIKSELDRGFPVAVLGYWLNPGVLHWVLAVGYGNDAMLAMDPWQGRMVAFRWAEVLRLAAGDVVTYAGK